MLGTNKEAGGTGRGRSSGVTPPWGRCGQLRSGGPLGSLTEQAVLVIGDSRIHVRFGELFCGSGCDPQRRPHFRRLACGTEQGSSQFRVGCADRNPKRLYITPVPLEVKIGTKRLADASSLCFAEKRVRQLATTAVPHK